MKTLKNHLIATTAAALALSIAHSVSAQRSDRGSQSENPTATQAPSDTTGSQQQQQQQASTSGQQSTASQPDYTGSRQQQSSSATQQDTTASRQQSETETQSTDSRLQSQQSREYQQSPRMAESQTEKSSAGMLRIADDDAEDRSVRKFAGREVRGSDGKDLGKVKDLLVDPQSGDVVYSVVSSGGFIGIGEKLYLVPFKALQAGTDKDKYTVSITKAELQQMTAISEDKLEEGRFTVSDDERRQIAQRFEGAQSGGAASGSSYYTASISSNLVLASELRGKDVHAGTEEIGTIEHVIVDKDSAKAMALFDAEEGFTDADAKFLVPLNRFTFGTTKVDRVTTMLTRLDFERVQSGLHTDAADTTASVPSASELTTTRTGVAHDTTTTDQTADIPRSTTGATSTTTDEQLSATGRATTSTDSTQTDITKTTDKDVSATARTSTEPSSGVASTTPRSSSASSTTSQTPSRTGVTPSESGTTPSGRTMPSASEKDYSQSTASTTDSARSQGIAGSSSTASSTPQTTEDESLKATGRTSTDQTSSVASSTPSSSSASPTTSETPSRTGTTPAESGTTPSGQSTARGQVATSTPESTTTTDQAQLGAGRTSSGQSASAAGVASVEQPSSTTTTTTEPELSPTGRTSADQSPTGDAALLSAAQAIRAALDKDDSLARVDVRVTPEDGKLVLRGKVKDESQKKSIEEKAEEAAAGKMIDSKLTIEK